MRTAALIKRILLEMLRDKRTLALLFLAPLLILTLMYFFFNGSSTSPRLGISHVDASLVKVLDKADMKIKHYETVKDPEQTVLNGNLDGLLVKKGGAYVLTLQNNDPSTAKSLQMKVKQAIAAESTQQLYRTNQSTGKDAPRCAENHCLAK